MLPRNPTFRVLLVIAVIVAATVAVVACSCGEPLAPAPLATPSPVSPAPTQVVPPVATPLPIGWRSSGTRR